MTALLSRFERIVDGVLGPLAGRSDAEVHGGPAGKWSPIQVVEHLAISLDWSSETFAKRCDREPMRRRPRTGFQLATRFVLLGLEWMPSGGRAPEGTRPAARPDRAAVERRFRAGHARFLALAPRILPARARDLFVKHPAMGDLSFEEWLRFHVVHCAHHARQIRERLPA